MKERKNKNEKDERNEWRAFPLSRLPLSSKEFNFAHIERRASQLIFVGNKIESQQLEISSEKTPVRTHLLLFSVEWGTKGSSNSCVQGTSQHKPSNIPFNRTQQMPRPRRSTTNYAAASDEAPAAKKSANPSKKSSVKAESKTTEKKGRRLSAEVLEERADKAAVHWEDCFKDLVKFHKKNGHSLVPKIYPENQKLAYWVQRNRK